MLTPADDYVHPVGPEPNFNESMYFHFHDEGNRVAGFLRLANRPNEGRGERTVCVYLPDGAVAFGFARPTFSDPAHFAAGGLVVESVEAFRRLRVSFEGTVNILDDPSAMMDPKAALSNTPVVKAAVQFELTALAPPYAETFDGDGESFAPHHYEQLMQISGTLQVGENTYRIGGYGLRDHSWGPRSWQAPWFYRWVHGTSPSLGFMGAVFGDRDGGERTGGFVWDGEQLHVVHKVAVSTVRDEDHQQQTMTVELVSSARTWTFAGQSRSSVPLRHRRPDGANATRIVESSVTWTAEDGSRINGMAEYLDQIVGGLPVGLRV